MPLKWISRSLLLRPTWSIGVLVRAHLAVFGIAFCLIGISQLAQTERWLRAPAYGVIYELFPPQVWGVLFITFGLVKLCASWGYPRFALWAISFGEAMVTAWAVSFTIGFAHTPFVPPTQAITWGVFAIGHLGVATLLAPRSASQPPPELLSELRSELLSELQSEEPPEPPPKAPPEAPGSAGG
jgi:hypothetical protein